MQKKENQPAVERLISANQALVRQVARRAFPDLARDPDLLQCGMIGLWRAAQRWDGARPFPPFARACIRNQMRNYARTLRRWNRLNRPLAEAEAQPAPDGETSVLSHIDTLSAIRKAFPPNSREAYILTALSNGVSKCAIAAALGLDTTQVTKIARRAYESMQKEDCP